MKESIKIAGVGIVGMALAFAVSVDGQSISVEKVDGTPKGSWVIEVETEVVATYTLQDIEGQIASLEIRKGELMNELASVEQSISESKAFHQKLLGEVNKAE